MGQVVAITMVPTIRRLDHSKSGHFWFWVYDKMMSICLDFRFPSLSEHFEYSGDPKTGHSKSVLIRNPDILKVGFRMVSISLDRFIYKEEEKIFIKWSRLINHLKTGRFCLVFEC